MLMRGATRNSASEVIDEGFLEAIGNRREQAAMVGDHYLEPGLRAVGEDCGDSPGVSAVRSLRKEQLRLQT